ncbi:hypothetical protein ACVBEQ_25060 [Nakamurella sp. GG22]
MQRTVADATEKAADSEDRSIKLEAGHRVAIDQARTELDQAVAMAYATGRDEVTAVIPGLSPTLPATRNTPVPGLC